MEVRMTASELFELLSQNKFFVRCGVSINLNLKYIRQISKDYITFDTGEHLAYPYRAYQKLKEAFLRFQMFTEE
jgi:DNA-binding LytR/AlgR family response regulator